MNKAGKVKERTKKGCEIISEPIETSGAAVFLFRLA